MNFLTGKFKVIKLCVLAVIFVSAGWGVYYLANRTPVCDCMFPNSHRYGVIGAGGTCRVAPCEVKKASK